MNCYSFYAVVLLLSFAAFSLMAKAKETDEFDWSFETKSNKSELDNSSVSTTGVDTSSTALETPNSKPKRCQDIKRKPMPLLRAFSAVGTFTVDLTLDPIYDSAIIMFVNNDASDIDGNSTLGNIVIAVGNNYFNLDAVFNHKHCNTINCMSKQPVTWYMHDYKFSSNGSYYCVYSCKGVPLQNYVCASTKPKFASIQSRLWMSIGDVPGGTNVHPARIDTCKTNQNLQCKISDLKATTGLAKFGANP